MIRVTITRDTVADGRGVFVGDVMEVPDEDAAMLLRLRKAVLAGDETVPVVDGKPAAKRAR